MKKRKSTRDPMGALFLPQRSETMKLNETKIKQYIVNKECMDLQYKVRMVNGKRAV